MKKLALGAAAVSAIAIAGCGSSTQLMSMGTIQQSLQHRLDVAAANDGSTVRVTGSHCFRVDDQHATCGTTFSDGESYHSTILISKNQQYYMVTGYR